jgi:hypothetical protein
MDPAAYDRAAAEHRDALARVRSGHHLTTGQLLDTLAQVDRREMEAIEHLTEVYRRVTHKAVGTNLAEYQRRMRLWQAIKSQCEHSPYAFAGQPKLIWWLEAAITQERLSAAPPLPAAPDFYAVDDRAWQRTTAADAPEVRTALEPGRRTLSRGGLAANIASYNSTLADLVAGLYDPRIRDAEELGALADRLAKMSLTRISLAADLLALAENQRSGLAAIEPVDTAITLARVKVSASRRRVLREAGQNTTGPEWDQLNQLNQVSRRLATLANGPDR